MTQPQVAERVGVTPGTYQKYEYGTAFPSPEKIDEIAKAFGVEIAELYINNTPQKVAEPTSDRSSLILEIHDKLRDLTDSQLGTINFTINGLIAQNPKSSKKGKKS